MDAVERLVRTEAQRAAIALRWDRNPESARSRHADSRVPRRVAGRARLGLVRRATRGAGLSGCSATGWRTNRLRSDVGMAVAVTRLDRARGLNDLSDAILFRPCF